MSATRRNGATSTTESSACGECAWPSIRWRCPSTRWQTGLRNRIQPVLERKGMQMQWNVRVSEDMALPAGALATLAGVRLTRIVPEKLFFAVVQGALFIVSVKLIWESGSRLLHWGA